MSLHNETCLKLATAAEGMTLLNKSSQLLQPVTESVVWLTRVTNDEPRQDLIKPSL